MHRDQLPVTVDVARDLIHSQFPDWKELPVRSLVSAGTVNSIFRIGDELTARFPLCHGDAGETLATLEREALAAAELAKHCPVPTPRPVAIGAPGPGYPLPWSVQTWVTGTVALESDPGKSLAFADDVASVIAALRTVDTHGARFSGEQRGGDLRSHEAWIQTCFQHSEGLLEVALFRELWDEMRELPRTAPDVMSHGDLVPGNLLVDDGRLAGILDAGGFGPADPALDLIVAWHLLDDAPRTVLRRRLDSDDLEWSRSKAWAFEQSMGAVWYYAESNPAMSAMGRRTLERILADRERPATAT